MNGTKTITNAQLNGKYYTNPLLADIADPDVLLDGGTYYLYATTPSENVGGIKVSTSTDLVHWTDKGLAMKAGSKNWGTNGFWAPDVIKRDNCYYMYYTANEHLCVAVSTSPLGPYVQPEFGPMHSIKEIDAHAFCDEDNHYYLYFVRFNDGNHIWGARLNDDMISIDEDTVKELLVPSQEWEKNMANINEGPYMLKHDGYYYLTYSGSHFESPMYGVGYATSSKPLGPYTKNKNNPIMQSNSMVHGAGHHGITTSPNSRELFAVYHCHNSLAQTEPRQFNIDRIRFIDSNDDVDLLEVVGPTITPQLVPDGAIDVDNFIQVDRAYLMTELQKKQCFSEESLPKKVKIITSKSLFNQSKDAEIEWATQMSTENEKLLIGNVLLPANIKNLGNLDLQIKINISDLMKDSK